MACQMYPPGHHPGLSKIKRCLNLLVFFIFFTLFLEAKSEVYAQVSCPVPPTNISISDLNNGWRIDWQDKSSGAKQEDSYIVRASGYVKQGGLCFTSKSLPADRVYYKSSEDFCGCSVNFQVCAVKSGCAEACSTTSFNFPRCPCRYADIYKDENNVVDLADLVTMGVCYGCSSGDACWTEPFGESPGCFVADLVGDGVINDADADALSACYNTSFCDCVSEGFMSISIFNDANGDGLKDASEPFIPTSVLAGSRFEVVHKSDLGGYTVRTLAGQNYWSGSIVIGDYRVVLRANEVPVGWEVTKWSVKYTAGGPWPTTETYGNCGQWGESTHCTIDPDIGHFRDGNWPIGVGSAYGTNIYLGLKQLPTYTLSGRVWMDTVIENCVVNADETKLAGRTVTVQGLGKSDDTDANGSYSIAGIPAGTYEVCVDSPPGNPYLACRKVRDAGGTWANAPATSSLCSQVTITALDKNLNLGFRPTYTISGRVWKDTVLKNCWINQPEGEVRLQGRTVSIAALGLSDVTDNNGWYSLAGVPSSVLPYSLCVDTPPNTSNPWDLACARETDEGSGSVLLPDPPALCVDVTVRDVDKNLILGLRPHWNLTGYVWNDTPAPNCTWDAAPPPQEGKFNNLNISVTGTDPLKTGATGPNGENYNITDIEEGSYQVCTSKPDTYDWKLMCAKDEGGSSLPITGDCAALTLAADKTLNYGLRQTFPPWFQVSDSDVHSNGDLTVDISSQATNPCFVATGRGFGGLVTAVGDINLNGQPVSCIVTKRWQIPQYDPIAWAKTVRLNWEILTAAPETESIPWGNLTANTVYFRKTGLDLNPPGYKVPDGGVAVVVVEGDLNFRGDFKADRPDEIGLIFLVRNGQTTVAKNVGSIDALVLNEKGTLDEGGRITVEGDGQQKDEVLTVNGGLFAEEGLSFQRDRALETDENKEPVVILNFNPIYLALLGPDIPGLSTHYISWREVQISQE